MLWAREGLKDGFEHCQESVYVRMLAKAYHRKIPMLESSTYDEQILLALAYL